MIDFFISDLYPGCPICNYNHIAS